MYKFYSRPKFKINSAVTLITMSMLSYILLSTLNPSKIKSPDNRFFTDGIQIKVQSAAPPIAALEDTWIENKVVNEDEEELNRAFANTENIKRKPQSLQADSKSIKDFIAKYENEKSQIVSVYTPVQSVMQNSMTKVPVKEKTIKLKDLGLSREDLLKAVFNPIVGGSRPVSIPRSEISVPRVIAQKASPLSNTIIGDLEMIKGLALADPKDQIIVYREKDGQTIETAQVWSKEAKFEIMVQDFSGELVAQLRSPQGEVLGEGRISIESSKPLIQLAPSLQGLKGRIIAAYTPVTKQTIPIENLSKVNIAVESLDYQLAADSNLNFSDKRLLNQSTLIMRAQKKSYYPSISVATAGEENQLQLVDEQSILNLLSTVQNTQNLDEPALQLKDQAIIWGRVTKNSEPAEGARVDIMTSDRPIKTIYFNKMMIPDTNLTSTSANGMYAIVGVTPAVHAVQVSYHSVLTDPAVVPTDFNSVTNLDLSAEKTKTADISVYDAITPEMNLPASISSLGQGGMVGDSMNTNEKGRLKYKYHDGNSLMVLDADSGPEYELTRVTLARSKTQINIPMISSRWYERLLTESQSEIKAYTGSIFGFIQSDQPYKVVTNIQNIDLKIIYFDNKANVTTNEYGEPGGGFAIINCPEGLQSISVVLKNSQKFYSQSFLVDRSVMNSFSYWFR